MRITGEEPDIMLVTEILPKARVAAVQPARLAIPGYKVYLSFLPDDSNLSVMKPRGICIYVRDCLPCSEVKLNYPIREHLWISICLRGSDKLLIGCIYKSPSSSAESVNQLGHLLNLAVTLKPTHLLITGDFNAPEIDWSTETSRAPTGHWSHEFLELLRDHYLTQHVLTPTRYRPGQTPHVLDLVLTSEEGMVCDLQSHPPLGSSDHVILTFTLRCYISDGPTAALKPALHRGDYGAMIRMAREVAWDVPEGCTVDQHNMVFRKTLDSICERGIPRQRPNGRKRNLYMTREALALQNRKKKLWKTYLQTQNVLDYYRFSRTRTQLKSLTRRLRRDFERQLANNLTDNPKAFWRYVHSRLTTRTSVDDLITDNGIVASTDAAKAKALADAYSRVFCWDEDPSDVPTMNPQYDGPLLENLQVTPKQVERKLRDLRPTSSPGPDAVHAKVLHELAAPLCLPLAELFNHSLEDGKVPEEWKLGQVVPIYKKGPRNDPSNYRPVSLTSVTPKVLESLVRDALFQHLSETGQLTECQHGFRPGRSCATQLLCALEDWTLQMEGGQPVDVAYLDFRRAFDSVPHLRLLRKLHDMGVRGTLLEWLRSFLTERKQRVVVNGSVSDWTVVGSGIPQGTVLGPVLFIAFVNDLPGCIESSCKLFADDTKVYVGAGTECGREQLQRDLEALANWSRRWKLPFNPAKCTILHLGSQNVQAEYCIEGSALRRVESEGDLGVRVDQLLKFKEQAAAAVGRANRTLGLIKHSFVHLDSKTLPLLYKAMVRPHLEYCNQVWGPFNIADMKLVERVQRRASRLVPELRHLPYEERLKKLRLPSLQYRRRRGDMVLMYNMMNGCCGLDKNDFFEPAPSTRTRGHRLKVAKKPATTRVRRNHFAARVVSDWNGLPEEVACAPSTNTFKNRLDKHWTKHLYIFP